MKNCSFFYLPSIAGSLVILLAACQANATPTNVTNIKVYTALPARAIIDTEEIRIPNCEGSIDTIQTLGSIKTVEAKSELDTIGTSTEGFEHEIPETLRLQLEIEIANAYQQSYQNAIERIENVSLDAVQGFETVYVIHWERLNHRGRIHYSIGDRVYKVYYLYQLVVPKLLSREKKVCNGKIEATLSPQ